MPAIAVGTAAIATHAEILRMSTFCCMATLPSAAVTSELSMSSYLVIQYVAHVSHDLDGNQVVVVGAEALQRDRQRAHSASHLNDLALEHVDGFNVGRRGRREDVLLHRVDVGLDEIG